MQDTVRSSYELTGILTSGGGMLSWLMPCQSYVAVLLETPLPNMSNQQENTM